MVNQTTPCIDCGTPVANGYTIDQETEAIRTYPVERCYECRAALEQHARPTHPKAPSSEESETVCPDAHKHRTPK